MALHGQHDVSAIFSPSVARIAESTAKDWAYVDSWLASRFPPGQAVPRFERNPATLTALLAAASVNEAADDSCRLLHHANENSLRSLSRRNTSQDCSVVTPGVWRDRLLSSVINNLSQDGRAALEALSLTAVSLGVSFPRCEELCSIYNVRQVCLFDTEQAIARVDGLKDSIAHEVTKASETLSMLRGHVDGLPTEMPRENVELQRRAKARVEAPTDAPEARVPTLMTSSPPTIKSVIQEERRLLTMQADRRRLETQLAAFERLPSDPTQARQQLVDLQQKLASVNAQRDRKFEALVECASPTKHP